jgi:diaminobutyrate-2-oxoglutarate transaminase
MAGEMSPHAEGMGAGDPPCPAGRADGTASGTSSSSGVLAQPREERFKELHFAPAPLVAGRIPGPESQRMLAEQAAVESRARSYPRSVPVAWEEGRGATVKDVDGNTYLDFFGGAGTLNVGHGHPAAAAAASEQQRKLVHALDFPTKARLALMHALKRAMPGVLKRTAKVHFGGPTGSDAVEAALKLTRSHTQRRAVVAFSGSYHGMTEGALAVTSDTSCEGPVDTPVHFMPYPYCYRCPLGLRPNSCALACAKLLQSTLEDPHSGVPRPAAVIVEPIQGEGGTIVPPKGWLKEIRRITRAQEVPLIADEIQTGFGRTGTMWACEDDGVVPDVLVMSKALGGIGLPLSAIAYDGALDTWEPGAHIGTFRGHQMAMAAGAAALEFTLEQDLPSHAAQLGELALATLREAAKDLESVGEVRGRGLMIGIELVRDPHTKEPWQELADEVRRACCGKGLIIETGGHYGNVARFLPPLVLTRELLLRGLEIFMESLRETEATLARRGALAMG